MSGIWDYPVEPEPIESRLPRDEDDIYEEMRDRKIWEESQGFQQRE